jgi:3-hydroxyacyl-CoA dehydrogenase/enoyl-CoA hydratase/3-hydroxybutyryl-CoA epimerase
MPVGPLAVTDEVSLLLQKKVLDTHAELDRALGVTDGYPGDMTATRAVTLPLLADTDRGGRHYGGGFYDYRADGTKALWPGLSAYAKGNGGVSPEDIRDRLLFRQTIETLRCYDEGVLLSEAEANIGSIFAFGFPAHTGGALQFIHWYGEEAFAQRAAELEALYGPRFRVTDRMLGRVTRKLAKAA